MENLRKIIKEELLPLINLKDNYQAKNKSYQIIEECDVYGFSSLNYQSKADETPKDDHKTDILEAFRNDENWHNPASVELMMRSYEVDEPYSSFNPCNQKNVAQMNYMTIRAEQNHLLSIKIVEEGMVLLQNSQIAESIKKFTSAISYDDKNCEAYFARGNAYFRLREWSSALVDAEKAVNLNPDCAASSELLKAIKSHYQEPTVSDLAEVITSNTSDDVTLIQRLKASLAVDQGKEDKMYEDSNQSIHSKDSNSSDDSSRSERHKKKRKRKHKKHKSKKRKTEKHHKSHKAKDNDKL